MNFIKILPIIAFITASQFDATGQNLVPNPSFEEYSICPDGYGLVDYALDWHITKGSPDYFNACAGSSGEFSVPNNNFGNQLAASGMGYIGFLNWTAVNPFYEHFGTTLTSPLIVGATYYLSFKINTAGDSINSGVATNKMGFRFTNVMYDFNSNPSPNDNVAHLYENTIIYDTVNWITVSGTFIADSAYTNIVIGNFFEYDSIDTTIVHYTASASYYFIDDIYVSHQPQTSGLELNGVINIPVISPNPTNGILSIKSELPIEELLIIDISGNVIKKMTHPPNKIDVTDLKNGLYFIRFVGKNGILGNAKFTKN